MKCVGRFDVSSKPHPHPHEHFNRGQTIFFGFWKMGVIMGRLKAYPSSSCPVNGEKSPATSAITKNEVMGKCKAHNKISALPRPGTIQHVTSKTAQKTDLYRLSLTE